MNIKKINLNLLIALDALLSEQNVTRAAEKLFITQAALSNSLNQLRELFQDELLIRSHKGMLPTAKALQLQSKVKQALAEINNVFNPTEFDPNTAEKTFTLFLSDYGELVVLPKLMPYLQQQAPGIKFITKKMSTAAALNTEQSEPFDLAIGLMRKPQPYLEKTLLFKDAATCVARAKHPLFKKKMHLQEYLNAQHLAVHYAEDKAMPFIDQILQQQDLDRNVVLTVPHLLPALNILTQTDLIGTFPKLLVTALSQSFKLALQPPPFRLATECEVNLIWHKRFSQDPANLWLRDVICQLF